jgi:hypothetical protein
VRPFYLPILLTCSAFVAGCGGSNMAANNTTSPGPGSGSGSGSGSASNVLAVTVNGGPGASQPGGTIYRNAAFASATVCVPGSTSKCVTVDGLLVDTGASGLRIFDTALASLNLPAVNASNGSPAYDCVTYSDLSYLWGPVVQADVTLGGETATKLPIHIINSASNGVPSSCSNGGNQNEDTAYLFGANGILGVGNEPTDCAFEGANVCDPSYGLSTPPSPNYYSCSGGTCTSAFVVKANQVTNPVVLFPKDNNGVILEMPAATSPAASLSGSLVFGIGTESNNQLASTASVITLACDAFTTVFDGQTFGFTDAANCVGPYSAIDSGSNAIYFPNVANIPLCADGTAVGDLAGLYCPTTTQSFSATIKGQDGTSKSTTFNVVNAADLKTNSTTATDPVLPGLAGGNSSGSGFVLGMPFFYGKNVYTAIDGQSVPTGAPPAPWWAF